MSLFIFSSLWRCFVSLRMVGINSDKLCSSGELKCFHYILCIWNFKKTFTVFKWIDTKLLSVCESSDLFISSVPLFAETFLPFGLYCYTASSYMWRHHIHSNQYPGRSITWIMSEVSTLLFQIRGNMTLKCWRACKIKHGKESIQIGAAVVSTTTINRINRF